MRLDELYQSGCRPGLSDHELEAELERLVDRGPVLLRGRDVLQVAGRETAAHIDHAQHHALLLQLAEQLGRLRQRQVPLADVALLRPDTLVLDRRGERIPIANSRIDLIEVSRGVDRRRGVWRGTLLGGLVGAGLGATFGALGAQHLPTGVGASAALGFLGGGLVGGGLGAGAGAVFPPERWQGYRIDRPPPER